MASRQAATSSCGTGWPRRVGRPAIAEKEPMIGEQMIGDAAAMATAGRRLPAQQQASTNSKAKGHASTNSCATYQCVHRDMF
eukprot:scaffold22410_cov112-Isochrysis_galbana.AAC.1